MAAYLSLVLVRTAQCLSRLCSPSCDTSKRIVWYLHTNGSEESLDRSTTKKPLRPVVSKGTATFSTKNSACFYATYLCIPRDSIPPAIKERHCILNEWHFSLKEGHCVLMERYFALTEGHCVLMEWHFTLMEGHCVLMEWHFVLVEGHCFLMNDTLP
jgi:hypothetical protein